VHKGKNRKARRKLQNKEGWNKNRFKRIRYKPGWGRWAEAGRIRTEWKGGQWNKYAVCDMVDGATLKCLKCLCETLLWLAE
jgi:hypothetical protein